MDTYVVMQSAQASFRAFELYYQEVRGNLEPDRREIQILNDILSATEGCMSKWLDRPEVNINGL